MGRGGDEKFDQCMADPIGSLLLISRLQWAFAVGANCLVWGTVGYFVWGVDYHQPEISWQSATCQLHASHLSIMYDSENLESKRKGKRKQFQEAMVSHDVDVFAANSQSFRVHTACHEYDVKTGTCGSRRICTNGECSSSAVGHLDWKRLRTSGYNSMDRVKTELGSKYRNSSISCDCEVCATDAKYCATSIPRLGFMNEDGTGNTEHTPSCCAAGRDDGTTLRCDTYDVSEYQKTGSKKTMSKCSFPFVYKDLKYSSCSIADTTTSDEYGTGIFGIFDILHNKHIFCGVADASESSGFDYERCNMGSCNGPVNVSGKLKTADVRTGSADPIVPCWYDTHFRARVPQYDRNGVPDNDYGLEEFSFHPVSILEPDLAGRNKDDYRFMYVLTLSMIGIGVVASLGACALFIIIGKQELINQREQREQQSSTAARAALANPGNSTEMDNHMKKWRA